MAGRDSHVRPIRQKNGGLSGQKEIDKTHKKRYILFINARKKSVRRFRHPESRGLLKTRYGSAACCRF